MSHCANTLFSSISRFRTFFFWVGVGSAQLSPYFPAVVMSLLTRLQANKTDKFANLFVCFVLYTLAIRVDGMTPDYVVGVVEAAQVG
jgi:CAS/CSE protein, C-terminus